MIKKGETVTVLIVATSFVDAKRMYSLGNFKITVEFNLLASNIHLW